MRRLADAAGLLPELYVIEEQRAQGIFAMHNDLTTCLRHGDVTAVHPDGQLKIWEVKRSEGAEDAAHAQRGRDAVALINKRRHTFADGQMQHIVSVPVAYRTYLQAANALLPRARRRGYAGANVSPVQYMAVIDHAPDTDSAAEWTPLHERALNKVPWWVPQTRIVQFTAALRRMRDRRDSFPSVAPLSIYPFDVEDVADLMLGRLDMFTALNLDGLVQQFAQKGIHVEIAHSEVDGASDRFLTAHHRVFGRELIVEVNPTVREQMLIELMTPANAIAQVGAMIRAVEAESRPTRVERVPAMADEARVWR